MDLENRISLMVDLGKYMVSGNQEWIDAKERAYRHNPWFTPAFINLAIEQIVSRYLQRDLLERWSQSHHFPQQQTNTRKVGLVMAGNIPLVGFHDFLSVFISGHHQLIKPSAKDEQLLTALLHFLHTASAESQAYFQTASLLKGCDAYIATGSNNTARYFDYYFGKYPSLIRRNRTSVAILSGDEDEADLENLADDVHLYFGLGCRNVTKIFVPENYDFQLLLRAFRKYHWLADHHRYKNNYDYQLSLAILNKQNYMTNESILLMEAESPFSPISIVHYSFYRSPDEIFQAVHSNSIQCIVGKGFIPFGKSQQPELSDYADGADTLLFLRKI
ncbi:MAG: acyl-CoA reductase [Bacteroidota bacterium]|nr:acyl-CoA reductase [Bacteroidota bacterium]MDP4212744.1 acyl-CoA reductase [Bacteroidota bacterium]MDP4249351.1 acyl-CoA reductase [Bacteroidota bacterium]